MQTEQAIASNFATFDALVSAVERFCHGRHHTEAAACAGIAAEYAWLHHAGLFAASRLEGLLLGVGRKTAARVEPRPRRAGDAASILHVMTMAREIGGDTRAMWRWIKRDAGRRHSLAITMQGDVPVPQLCAAAVDATGGQTHLLDEGRGDLVAHACALRALARTADVVVLHLLPSDIVPLIAFADKDDLPPIVLVNHADHVFWAGVGAADIVVHLREEGLGMSQRRRGIDPRRCPVLPIPIVPVARSLSQSDAKAQLGIAEDTVVLLSIAAAFKYDGIDGIGFPELVTPALERHPNAVLLVVGPKGGIEWSIAAAKTGGRARVVGRRSDTAMFYQAADIYLDSFPFTSITSLLEAGSYGVPLVSYSPYDDDVRAVLGAGAPGLTGSLLRPTNPAEYVATISRLIEEPDFRARAGERARHTILDLHTGAGWSRALEDVYALALSTPPQSGAPRIPHASRADAVDILVHRLVQRSGPCSLSGLIEKYARRLPFLPRVRLLMALVRLDQSFSFGMFLPGWLGIAASGRSGWWTAGRRWMAGAASSRHASSAQGSRP